MAIGQRILARAAPECIAIERTDGVSVALKCVQTCQTVLPTHLAQAIVKTVIRSQMRWDLLSIFQKQLAGFHEIFIPG